jgi:hypothetical protein
LKRVLEVVRKIMTLQIFDRDFGDPSVMHDYENGRLHIVCVAANALTYFNAFATLSTNGISHNHAGELASIVNRKNETGTLWPKRHLTILPQSEYDERNDFGNRGVMIHLIKDAIKANEEYSKCPVLIFALERNQFDVDLAYEVLAEIVSQTNNWVHTQQIYYIPAEN